MTAEQQFYIQRDGHEFGPYTEQHLCGLISSGLYTSDDLACCEGSTNWFPLREVIPSLFINSAPHRSNPFAFLLDKLKLLLVAFAIVAIVIAFELYRGTFDLEGISFSGNRDESVRRELVTEGKAISDSMELANRNHDFRNVKELKARQAEFFRRSDEYVKKHGNGFDPEHNRLYHLDDAK